VTVLASLVHHCPICGVEVDCDWLEISAFGDAQPSFAPGKYVCPTPRCGQVCKVCRREVGDIHSGACSAIVLAKIDDPCRVSREDCR
jgi:hypothetical protein